MRTRKREEKWRKKKNKERGGGGGVSRWSCWLAHAPRRRTERAPGPPVGHLVLAAPCAWCCAAALFVCFVCFSLQYSPIHLCLCVFCLPTINLLLSSLSLVNARCSCRLCGNFGSARRCVVSLRCLFLLFNYFPIRKRERQTQQKWDVAPSFVRKFLDVLLRGCSCHVKWRQLSRTSWFFNCLRLNFSFDRRLTQRVKASSRRRRPCIKLVRKSNRQIPISTTTTTTTAILM